MRCIGLLFLLLAFTPLRASHIIGGNFQVTQTGRNSYTVNLTVFRDCGTGGANPIQLVNSLDLFILDGVSGALLNTDSVVQQMHFDVSLEDSCHSPPELCVEQYELSSSFSLPDNPNGYILTTNICCRNSAINNIIQPGTTGMLWYAAIPDPALADGNSTPKTNDFPEDGYFCLDLPRTIDLRATDVDGDSLFYELVDPFGHQPGAPPFSAINWSAGFSATSPIPTNTGLQLDGNTGILSGTASALGKYVLSYRISEYRDGVLLGYLNRDIQIEVLQCIYAKPPHILLPLSTQYEAKLLEESCITIAAIDSNTTETLSLNITSKGSEQDGHNPSRFPSNTTQQKGYIEKTICWTPNCIDGLKNQHYTIEIAASSPGCDSIITKTQVLEISLEQNLPTFKALFPNVFTPNGDGNNDFFEVNATLTGKCVEQLYVRVFSRWGALVYEAPVDQMHWDGRDADQSDLSPGVYYYSVSGNYGNETIVENGFVTLMR